MLVPIPTRYADTAFRSRAEARWAVLFDRLGIKWKYEAEGYQLPSCWYLPDFYLPEFDCFAEVKGGTDQWDPVSEQKALELCEAAEKCVLLLDEFNVTNQHVRVVTHQHGEAQIQWVVDLSWSVKKGRLWFEFDDAATVQAYKLPDDEWYHAALRARNYRFERHV